GQTFSAVPLVDVEPSPVSAMRISLAKSRQLESETGTTEEHSLNKEARKWATRVAREHKNIIHSQRLLDDLECQSTPASEQGRMELEQRIEEVKESIRKAEHRRLYGVGLGGDPATYMTSTIRTSTGNSRNQQ
ncbi:hypothetical protein GDO78_015634, partial [Eleutherodactylus coqui]